MKKYFWGAAKAQWTSLGLPSCRRLVWVPSTPSTLLSFIVNFVLYLSFAKNENKQKKPSLAHLKKCFFYLTTFFTPLSTSQWVFIEERCRLLTSKSPFRLNHQQGRFTSGRVKGRFEGRGCDTVDSAVASDTRGPGFESSHWQLFEHIYG